MKYETLLAVLGWGAVINIAIVLFWFLMLVVAKDFVHRLHGRWFDLSRERFDYCHYLLLGAYKLGNLLLFIVPYVAMRIVGP